MSSGIVEVWRSEALIPLVASGILREPIGRELNCVARIFGVLPVSMDTFFNDQRIRKGYENEKSQREKQREGREHVDCIIFLVVLCYMHVYIYRKRNEF